MDLFYPYYPLGLPYYDWDCTPRYIPNINICPIYSIGVPCYFHRILPPRYLINEPHINSSNYEA